MVSAAAPIHSSSAAFKHTLDPDIVITSKFLSMSKHFNGRCCESAGLSVRLSIFVFLKPIKKGTHLVLCEQRNGRSVVRPLSRSQRQAACCNSGTPVLEQDERDNDANVACLLETVKRDSQVLLLQQDRVRSLHTEHLHRQSVRARSTAKACCCSFDISADMPRPEHGSQACLTYRSST